jgi:hypothetical protein
MRSLALIAVCGLAALSTACGSKNKGKIEGKWKLTEAPTGKADDAENFKQMAQQGLYMYFDFKGDNTLTIGLHSDNEEMIKMMKSFAPNQQLAWTVKYKLLSGESVEFYDLPKELQEKGGGGLFGTNKDKARTKVHIDGDNMTMTDSDGKSGKLVRIK